jgi:hypothetical protein
MNCRHVIDTFAKRGIRLAVEADKLVVDAPEGALTPSDLERLRGLKPYLFAYLREQQAADRALSLLNRLKTYTLPTGRMPAARALVERLRPLADAGAGAILAALEALERELIELGARPDPGLLDAVEAVESVFPRTQLVEIRQSEGGEPGVELAYPEQGPAVRPLNPEFPPCPECRIARYWIAPTGKVVCGACGQTRFILTAIEYHALQ